MKTTNSAAAAVIVFTFLLGLISAQVNTTVPTTSFNTTLCHKECFSVMDPSWFFCSHSRSSGFCCPNNSTVECQDSPTNEVYCSRLAANPLLMRYAFCPRHPGLCSTGALLRPLLNQNQSLSLVNKL